MKMSAKHIVTEDRCKIFFDHYPSGHKSLIVVAHGFFNSKDARLLKELGRALSDQYDVVIMDFRGHGKSEGLFYWTTKEYLDLEAVLAWARPQYQKIGVIGFSLGAAISLITAARTDSIDSLVAVSSPAEFEKIEYRFWELDMGSDVFYNLVGEGRFGKGVKPGPFWLKKNKPIELVEKIKAPVFYIHGEADWLIKPWHSQELFRKTKSPKKLTIIKNGPHAEYLILKNKNETVELLHNWFNETLKEDTQ